MKKKNTILLQACLLLAFILTAFCITGCRAEPEDTLPVEWDYKNGGDQGFVYEGVHYRRQWTSQWDVEYDKTVYMGHLFVGGATGSYAPMKVFGIPFISGYAEAKGYFIEGRETPVLIQNDSSNFWLDTDITLESPENCSFSTYTIRDRREGSFKAVEFTYREDVAFTFEDMIDRNKILKAQDVGENDNHFSIDFDKKHVVLMAICLPLDFPECLYCHVEVYEIDGLYYISDTFRQDGRPWDTLVALSGKWQGIIAETVSRGGDETPQ